ncbi:zinc transporter ZIP11 isoform X4 [Gasterosteus aculeatus]
MLEGYSPVTQALLGTLFTWALTAAGAALVFVFSSRQKRILDGSLGFAAGGVGADPHIALALPPQSKLPKEKADEPSFHLLDSDEMTIRIDKMDNGDVYQRRRGPQSAGSDGQETGSKQQEGVGQATSSWRRIVLLILAITIHNIPEGLAVGVGFGAIGKTSSATFESARNLAIGIGIQNFPEGLAVSLPLRGAGMSTWRAFWYGQLSGMVEPIAGLLGAGAVVLAEPLLPYALAFAAGAMVYVVVDDIIPEAQLSGNGKLASWTSILGFVVMMSLDVGLG